MIVRQLPPLVMTVVYSVAGYGKWHLNANGQHRFPTKEVSRRTPSSVDGRPSQLWSFNDSLRTVKTPNEHWGCVASLLSRRSFRILDKLFWREEAISFDNWMRLNEHNCYTFFSTRGELALASLHSGCSCLNAWFMNLIDGNWMNERAWNGINIMTKCEP